MLNLTKEGKGAGMGGEGACIFQMDKERKREGKCGLGLGGRRGGRRKEIFACAKERDGAGV